MVPAKQLTADAFFLLQIVLALISGGSQFLRLLSTSEGVSISWLGCWLAFLVINLTLTVRAHHRRPSRVTLQTALIYALWTFAIALCLGTLLWRGTSGWDAQDTETSLVVAAAALITWLWGRRRGLPLTDPLVHGFWAVWFIGLPQLTLTYKILVQGGRGLAGGMLLAGHIGILTRLGMLWFAIREAGWDRNRLGAAIGELANEVTWLLVTLAWWWH